MPCARKAALEDAHRAARAKFNAAFQRLEKRIGISAREEYATLKSNVDAAWLELDYTRALLDAHIRRHGC